MLTDIVFYKFKLGFFMSNHTRTEDELNKLLASVQILLLLYTICYLYLTCM